MGPCGLHLKKFIWIFSGCASWRGLLLAVRPDALTVRRDTEQEPRPVGDVTSAWVPTLLPPHCLYTADVLFHDKTFTGLIHFSGEEKISSSCPQILGIPVPAGTASNSPGLLFVILDLTLIKSLCRNSHSLKSTSIVNCVLPFCSDLEVLQSPWKRCPPFP